MTGQRHPTGIHVGPHTQPDIAAAIRRAGGEVVAADKARAIVWLSNDTTSLAVHLTRGVEWVQLASAGIESYMASGVITSDRLYTSAGPAYADNVAEHALALMLACGRNLYAAFRADSWLSLEIQPLRGSTVLIIGCGRIGRSLIAHLEPFRVTVLASTRSGDPVPGAVQTVAAGEEGPLFGFADYVVLAAPATAASRHLVGREQLSAMGRHAYLVNVARGSLVDTDALVAALRADAIAGAALDVTDPEPLPSDHPLWHDSRVLVTPHIANTYGRVIRELTPIVEENVRHFLRAEPLIGLIRPELGY